MTPETTPSPVDSIDLHRASLEEVLATLRVTARTGLSDAEAEARLRRYGPNEIPEEQRHPVREFLKKFWGLSAWMLELIMVMSWAVQKYADVVVVGALLLVNAIVSFVQERRASGVIDALRRRLQVTARVQRNGAWQVVPARDLVPGDIVRVRQGDFVPADGRMLSGELRVDQAALTGESLEANKRSPDLLYSGSVVRRGEATAAVILTGARTFFGRTTELVQRARPNPVDPGAEAVLGLPPERRSHAGAASRCARGDGRVDDGPPRALAAALGADRARLQLRDGVLPGGQRPCEGGIDEARRVGGVSWTPSGSTIAAVIGP